MIALEELRDSARKAFPADAPPPARADAWRMVAELGWLMVELDESDGGLGLGRGAAAAIAEELARALAPAPVIPALLGLRALAGATALDDRDVWIARVVEGAYIPLNLLPGTLADDGAGALTGCVRGFLDADLAGHVIAGASERYVLVATDAPGVSLVEQPLWDESRRMFELRLESCRDAVLLAEGDAARALHDDIARSAHLLVAADALGAAQAALAMTIDYLKVRRQFDRPLALFQALKHRCADLETRRAAAEALLWSSAAQADQAPPWRLGAMKALATGTAFAICEEAIQLHGGIGLTMEHPIHRHLKRVLLDAQLCGDADVHDEAAGRALLEEMG